MSVLVRDSEGRTTSRYPLPVSGEFEIEYVHSYYQAPAVEHFVAEKEKTRAWRRIFEQTTGALLRQSSDA